jgi:hypothetical protein
MKMISIMAIILERELFILKMKKIELKIKKAADKDKSLIKKWLSKPHLLEHFKYDQERKEKGSYWVSYAGKTPLALILTQMLSPESPPPFGSWVEPEGTTLLIDVAALEGDFADVETMAAALKEFISVQPVEIKSILADAEVKQTAVSDAYEQAGFARLTTFVKGSGFFKGSPHYLLKFSCPQS